MFATRLALPVLLLFDKKIRNDFRSGLIYEETILLAAGITAIAKVVSERTRSYAYNENVPEEIKLKPVTKRFFFSGHAALSAATTFYMAIIYNKHHPRSRLKPLIWSLTATISAVTSSLRIIAGKHFITDVVFGYFVGAATGYLVPQLHKIFSTKKKMGLSKL